MADHYADGTCRWWHLSRPSPELAAALGDGWLPRGGRGLDVGCGLGTEAGYLAAAGWRAAGIDLSQTALVAVDAVRRGPSGEDVGTVPAATRLRCAAATGHASGFSGPHLAARRRCRTP